MNAAEGDRTRTPLQSLFAQAGGVTGAFSSKAADYVASRPGYPAALFDALHALGALFAQADVADVGAGTGLLTEALLQRAHAVTAVEPNAAMRAAADARLHVYANYRSVAAGAEATMLGDAAVDLITVAQAFHRFDVEAFRRECLRILKPRGQVALIWNTRPLGDPLQNAIAGVFAEFGGDQHIALEAQQDMANVPQFFAGAPFHDLSFAHVQQLDRDGLLSLVFSRSFMPARDTSPGRRAARAINDLFDGFADAGEVTVRYRTRVMVGRPSPPLDTSA
jgi:SAM-dependent methyltransferase